MENKRRPAKKETGEGAARQRREQLRRTIRHPYITGQGQDEPESKERKGGSADADDAGAKEDGGACA